MSQDHLGLFDTPPNRQQIRFSLAIVGLLFVAFLLHIAGARHSIARDRCVHPDDRRHHVPRRADHRHPALRPGRRLSVARPDRPGHGLRLRGTASHPARAHLSRRLCPGRTAWRRGQHHGVARHLPAGGASHRHHSLCPAQAGGFGSAARNGTAGGEDPGRGACGHRPGSGGHAAGDASDTTGSRRSSSIVPTSIYANAVGYRIRDVRAFRRRDGLLFRKRNSVLDMWLLVALSGWLIQSLLIMTLQADSPPAGIACSS